MKRILLSLLLLLTPVAVSAQSVLTPADLTLTCTATLAQNGLQTPVNQGLTTRTVNGQLRLLTIASGRLQEVAAPDCNQTASAVIRSWDLGPTGALRDFTGIWWEEAKQRLWINSGIDYPAGDGVVNARVVTVKLNDNGTLGTVHTVYLSGVNERKADGGCQPSPIQGYAYVCGFGGYHSRLSNGPVSIGPFMAAIPDPDNSPNGATITPKIVLDASSSRGVRVTLTNTNYFDGGDMRPNGTTANKPTLAPAAGAKYVTGFMSYGDKYLNTGMWIDTGTKRGFVMIASLMKGVGWYCNSDLCFEGKQFEWHVWDAASLGANLLQRPTSMAAFNLPSRGDEFLTGNGPMESVAGAAYANGRIYTMNCGGLKSYQNTCQIGIVTVGGGVTPPPPPPVVIDADAIGTWSVWTGGAWQPTTCTTGTQTRTETRTFTVTTAATGAGKTPVSPETRTASQTCTVPTPTPTGIVLPSGSLIILPAGAATPAGTTPAGSVVKVN